MRRDVFVCGSGVLYDSDEDIRHLALQCTVTGLMAGVLTRFGGRNRNDAGRLGRTPLDRTTND